MIKVKKPRGGNSRHEQYECMLHPDGVVFCQKHTNIAYCAKCRECPYCTRTSLARNPKPPKKVIAMSRTRPARVQTGPQFVTVKAHEVRAGDQVERRNHRDPSEAEIVTIREVREVRLRAGGGRGYLVLHEPAFYIGSFTVKAHEEVAILKRRD